MFLEEVIPAFLSCHGPQNTQRCKSDADKQHACRGGEGGGFNVRGQRANHRRNEWEHLAFSGIFFLTFSGTNSRNFLEETKLLAVVPENVTPNVLDDKLMLKSAAGQIILWTQTTNY